MLSKRFAQVAAGFRVTVGNLLKRFRIEPDAA
jgi:hypothetical protein